MQIEVRTFEEFFFGCGDGSSKLAFEMIKDHKFNIMVNYAAKTKPIPVNRNLLFVDSGGFSFFCREYDYNYDFEKYLQYVLRKDANYFAVPDYPCEPELLKRRNTTVEENQNRTIENQLKIMELIDAQYPELKKRLVCVVQGWKVEDYFNMIEKLREQGLLTNLIGIGSICRRNREKEIRRIILALRNNLSSKYKLHAFGVKFNVLRYKDVWESLYSADSCSYRYWISGPEKKERIKQNILKWLRELENLKKLHYSQKTLLHY